MKHTALAMLFAVALLACTTFDRVAEPSRVRLASNAHSSLTPQQFDACWNTFVAKGLHLNPKSGVPIALSQVVVPGDAHYWCGSSLTSFDINECASRVMVLAGIKPGDPGSPCLPAV